VKHGALVLSLESVRQALAADVPGHERQWTEAVLTALFRLEIRLRQHLTGVAAPDGVFAEVDETRPTLARKKTDLHRLCQRLLEKCVSLQEEIRCAAGVFAPAAESLATAGSTVTPPPEESIPNFQAIRQRADQFLDELQKVMQAEANLILESINTDIGVGD
jgi:hypothetical protein